MIEIRVDPTQLVAGVPLIAGFEGKTNSAATRALDEAAAAIFNRLRTTYMAEQEPSGKPWIPSASGLRNKSRGTGKTMFDTGNLWRSIQLYRTSASERLIGTDVEYSVYHQGPLAKVQRPFLEITDQHLAIARKIFEFRLKEALS